MTQLHLDKAIWHVVPHFFEDEDGERLDYRMSLGGRTLALMRAGETMFYQEPDVPDWVSTTLKEAYKQLETNGHFTFESA